MAPSKAPPSIRRARKDEAEALASLHVSVWRTTYHDYAPPEAFTRLDTAKRLPYWTKAVSSDSHSAGVWIAEGAEKILGVVSFGPSQQAIFEGRTEIKHLYVTEGAQGQGIGRQLLNAVLERKDTYPDSRIGLAVVRQNQAARRFYQRMGGQEIGAFTDPGPLWPSQNILVAWD